MDRQLALQTMQQTGITRATTLYGAEAGTFELLAAYEGCANLVYQVAVGGKARILRVTHRADRSLEMLRAELDWIAYLAEQGVRVARPLPSRQDDVIETLHTDHGPLYMILFERAPGMRVPDNGYRYREGVPIDEYYVDWGQTLGAMHRCAKSYRPSPEIVARPGWFALHEPRRLLDERVPERYGLLRRRALVTLDEIEALPRDADAHGIIHGDFNDGNFTIDYATGAMTVFDLDDCCQFYFCYELAAAWEAGTGRTMFEGLEARRAFMDHYMDVLLTGYAQENTLSDVWLGRLPLFIKLVQLETFLYYARHLGQPDHEAQPALAYLMRCIEDDVPHMGFFSKLYDPAHPFELVASR